MINYKGYKIAVISQDKRVKGFIYENDEKTFLESTGIMFHKSSVVRAAKRIIDKRIFLYGNAGIAKIYLVSKDSFEQDTARPSHYGGDANPHEPRKIIKYYDLNFNLGNSLKYLLRCKRKGQFISDLIKAKQYIDFEIEEYNQSLKENSETQPAENQKKNK